MKQNTQKKIVIITNNPFPVGLASTNRILSYCKGFLHHGFQPEVFCFRPTEKHNNIFNYSDKGIFNDVKYVYPGGTTIRVDSFWGRRKNDLFGKYASLSLLYRTMKREDVALIILYMNHISFELPAIFFSKLFKIKIYKESSENPEIYFRKLTHPFMFIEKWFVINKLFKYYSGILAMTNPLREFFLLKGIPDRKILVVPQTVDQERFKNINNSTFSLPKEYITYVGSLDQQKDGVLTMVESFSEVSVKFPDLHLVIAGYGSQQQKNKLSSIIFQLNLNERVHYIGHISSNEIPVLFQDAKLLASCRPESLQADYGFPTKVIEYLASGKPVVTTATGELAFYLEDRVNAFIANKADKNTFALKLIEVLEDYDFAKEVAQNGKKLVKEKFNPVRQAEIIINWHR